MKNIQILIVLLLFSIPLFAQTYASVTQKSFNISTNNIEAKTTYHSVAELASEIVELNTFDYSEILSKSKYSNKIYKIGSKTYFQKELIKFFRKGAKRTENTNEFRNFLSDINPEFLTSIPEYIIKIIYVDFRANTINAYLDRVPSHIF